MKLTDLQINYIKFIAQSFEDDDNERINIKRNNSEHSSIDVTRLQNTWWEYPSFTWEGYVYMVSPCVPASRVVIYREKVKLYH